MKSAFLFISNPHLSLFFVVLEKDAQDHSCDADNETAKESVPKNGGINCQSNAKSLTNYACEPEEEGIDNEREKPQSDNNERKGKKIDNWAQNRIDQPKDEGQPNKR